RNWQSGCLHLDIDRIEQVIPSKLDAVAPHETLTKFYRHLGEIGIVDRLLGRQSIIPYTLDTCIRVDVPERIQGQLLETGYPAAAIAAAPAVEIICGLDSTAGILQDQALISGHTRGNFPSLGE